MFSKKFFSKKYFHITHAHTSKSHTKHAHISHAHYIHHVFMYGRIYKCTYCDRHGHLAKFYYDRINCTNNHVWVRSTNVIGPMKIWVRKSTTPLFVAGTHQGCKT